MQNSDVLFCITHAGQMYQSKPAGKDHPPREETIPVMHRISERMTLLTQATSIPAVWKVGRSLHVTLRLPECHGIHTCKFCQAVKERLSGGRDKCIHHDEVLIREAVRGKRTAFWQCCHAQAFELVIPIVHEDSYVATLLLGPFRSTEKNAEPFLQDEFQQLPLLSFEREQGLIKLAHLLFDDLTQELNEQIGLHLLPPRMSINDQRIVMVLEWLRQRFRQDVNVGSAAKRCGVSVPHFQHLFKQQTGLSFREYWQRLRILEAERLLGATTLPLAEVAVVSGLTDQSRMTLLFQRYFSMTPRSYRVRFGLKSATNLWET